MLASIVCRRGVIYMHALSYVSHICKGKFFVAIDIIGVRIEVLLFVWSIVQDYMFTFMVTTYR